MKEIFFKIKNNKAIQLFAIYLRYLIGGAHVFASIVKIKGEEFSTVPVNFSSYSAFNLFKVLFQSGVYWNFIGWMQILSGFLIMTQVQSTLGSLVLLPISLNIFFITYSDPSFANTLYISTLMLFANIFFIMLDFDKLIPIISKKTYFIVQNNSFHEKPIWFFLGLLFFIVSIISKILLGSFIQLLIMFIFCLALGLVTILFHQKNNE